MEDTKAMSYFTKREAQIEVGGRILVIKPLVVKKYDKIFEIISEGIEGISNPANNDTKLIEGIKTLVFSNIEKFIPIIFDEQIDMNFVKEYFTMPILVGIWEIIVQQNEFDKTLFPFLEKLQMKGMAVNLEKK